MEARSFVDAIQRELHVDFFAGVPDSLLKPLCDELVERFGTRGDRHVVAADEGGAVALACGHWLATGKPGAVYLQNSGIGNAVNPLCSLTNEAVYAVPTFLIVGWRGEPGVRDEPQHVFQGQISRQLLECVGVRVFVLDTRTNEGDLHAFLQEAKALLAKGGAAAVLVRKGALMREPAQPRLRKDCSLTRERAAEIVSSLLPQGAAVVSTTGKLSRELFEIRERRGEGHERDFLTVGSMGHSSMIGLGIAVSQPQRHVVVLDGDGALIMHTGAMAIIGQHKPRHFLHVVINNGAHETVGGMPTASAGMDYRQLAHAMGYVEVGRAANGDELMSEALRLLGAKGPAFLEVVTNESSRANLGRPTTSAYENGRSFQAFLCDGSER